MPNSHTLVVMKLMSQLGRKLFTSRFDKNFKRILNQLSAKGRFFHVCMCEKVTFGNISGDDLFMTI